MISAEYIQKLVIAATLYYTKNLNQQEVAREMGTNRQSVCKYLSDAKQHGIVEIKINNPINNVEFLSKRLENKFNLHKAVVVPGTFTDENITRYLIAQYAAEYVATILSNDYKKIGLSWGRTMYEFINQFPMVSNPVQADVFPLIGATNNAAPYFMINEMVRLYAEKICAIPHFTYMPIHPENGLDYDHYINTNMYRETLEFWQNIDLAIVGIGSSPYKTGKERQSYPGEIEVVAKLKDYDVVGDICTQYYDINGNIISIKELDKLITIPHNCLKNAKKVIALAGGTEKTNSIIGALRTGIISDMVIDEQTATAIVEVI